MEYFEIYIKSRSFNILFGGLSANTHQKVVSRQILHVMLYNLNCQYHKVTPSNTAEMSDIMLCDISLYLHKLLYF